MVCVHTELEREWERQISLGIEGVLCSLSEESMEFIKGHDTWIHADKNQWTSMGLPNSSLTRMLHQEVISLSTVTLGCGMLGSCWLLIARYKAKCQQLYFHNPWHILSCCLVYAKPFLLKTSSCAK